MPAMRRSKSTTLGALSLAALLAASGTATYAATVPEAEPAETFTLDLLGINDFHGRIGANGDSAGAAVLAGAVDTLRGENPNTFFVSAGDNIGASTFASASQDDNPTIDALGASGLDVAAVGNHEFDKGFADLAGRVIDRFAAATGDNGADFALGANVYEQGTETPVLQEYAIREVNGVSVGFIGTVTEDVPSLVSPSGITGLNFGNELEAANRVAAQLSDGDEANGEAQVIVLLTHNGSDSADCAAIAAETTSYGELVRGADAQIDAIFSGHTHQSYGCQITGPAGERPVLQAHQYGTTLGKISLEIDAATGSVLSSDTDRLALAVQDAEGNWQPNYTAKTEVQQIVDAAIEESDEVGSVQVGEISEDIVRGGDPSGSDRGVESTLGNTVADIHLWATSNEDYAGEPAQIAFMNPGGLRADLLYGTDGTVSYKDAAEVQPFANTLVTFDLTGAQIRQALEQQWQPSGSERAKLHLGISQALAYTYIEDAEAGSHIQEITFNGEPLDEAATFHVVANSFLASGGDNFTAFGEGSNHADSGQIDLDATVNYFKAHDVVSPAALGRAVIAGTDWAEVTLSATETTAGEDLQVTVSGLAEGAQISASAFAGAVQIDGIPAADAQGTTSFTLPVAADVETGEYELVISQLQREDIAIAFSVVAAAEEPTPTPTPTATEEETASPEPSKVPQEDEDQQQPDQQDLADTGFNASWIGIAAGIIVLAGILLLLVRRFGNKAGR